MLEREIEQKLRRGCDKLGALCMKWVSPGQVGVPDRIIFLPGGQVLLVEVKTETGKLSPVQVNMHRRLRKMGLRVITVAGSDEVKRLLEELRLEIHTAPVSGIRD